MIMKNNDVYNYFGECIDMLLGIAKQKLNDAADKIEKEKKFKDDSKESMKTISDAVNNVNNVLEYDLTTYEGYSKYMEYLGELRKKTQKYNDVLKAICGMTGEELVDEVAKEATMIYEEARSKNTEQKEVVKPECEPETTTCCKCCPDEPECPECVNDADAPSERIPYWKYESICNCIDMYFDEQLLPYLEANGYDMSDEKLDLIYDELVEYSCWLSTQN